MQLNLISLAQVLTPATPDLSGSHVATTTADPPDTGRCASITIAADRKSPGAARRHAMHVLTTGDGVDPEFLADVQLLVSEVVSNVIRHEKSTLVEVGVVVEADRAVTVTVSGNEGTAPAAMLHPAGAADTDSPTGRGLIILDSLADAWGVRRQAGRTAVWFTVRGAAPAEPRRGDADANVGAAAAVVAEAFEITAGTLAELTVPEQVAAQRAAATAEQAALGAAAKSAKAARSARGSRAMAATLAAEGVADTAARTVEAVQRQADEVAREVASAASAAAAALSRSISPNGGATAARAASQVAAAVISAAAEKSEETARAAQIVARAVAAAAAAVAATTAAAAADEADEVSDVADAVHAVAAAAAQQLIIDAFERGAALALLSRDATLASEHPQQTNG